MAMIAFISDIHSNLQALQAVLKDIRGYPVEEIFCLGDIVGYGANPLECLDLIFGYGIKSIQGNHDFTCSHPQLEGADYMNRAAKESAIKNWQILMQHDDHKYRDYLFELPTKMLIERYGIALVHGSPLDPLEEYIFSAGEGMYRTRDDRMGKMVGLIDLVNTLSGHHGQPDEMTMLGMGHTHVPYVVEEAGKIVFNPGSVGQPRDGSKEEPSPEAKYMLFDPERRKALLRKVPYDVKAAQQAIAQAGLPGPNAYRLEFGI